MIAHHSIGLDDNARIVQRCKRKADDVHDLKAWKVIDDAGMRGARRGGAQMSEKHPNFLINADGATAADLEGLGEDVRKKVYASSGITLQWEIMRVGDPA